MHGVAVGVQQAQWIRPAPTRQAKASQ
jgi:hypothetical protein